jgi:uncharacterized protein
MIIYKATKERFSEDVVSNEIEYIIHNFFIDKIGHSASANEINSWKNSMLYMNNILMDPKIPDDCGVAIEYQIPLTSKRIDFILAGTDVNKVEYLLIVELKQWSEASLTKKDGIVSTFVGKAIREVSHPSYQAWSYAMLLKGFNVEISDSNIQIKPCAYLHNYFEDGIINNEFYKEYLERAPVFHKKDALKLREFIKETIVNGDKTEIIKRIERSQIRPSKELAESVSKMLKGNKEFVLIDDQKVVYENALELARKSSTKNKNVLIVHGGPGTGKSVIAINLLVELSKMGLLTQYVSKNAAPRAVYKEKLKGDYPLRQIDGFFSGSGSYVDRKSNEFGALIVDEAHRLNEKSGMYQNLGENQIKELIFSSAFTAFFLDEDQRVTLADIGSAEEIKNWAEQLDANITELELSSQFRCSGSDGYIAWLDHILDIRPTANTFFDYQGFDFKVFDDPSTLRNEIFERNKKSNKSRLVAGYCWPWNSKKDPEAFDIEFLEYDFKMRWNLTEDGSAWVIRPTSVNEIGCIHTCQGLEVEYIGVIIGEDLIVRNGEVLVDPSKRDINDRTIRGYKARMKTDPVGTKKLVKEIIKNTYRTLMTRGMKGCYIYSVDKETNEYFKKTFLRKSDQN